MPKYNDFDLDIQTTQSTANPEARATQSNCLRCTHGCDTVKVCPDSKGGPCTAL